MPSALNAVEDDSIYRVRELRKEHMQQPDQLAAHPGSDPALHTSPRHSYSIYELLDCKEAAMYNQTLGLIIATKDENLKHRSEQKWCRPPSHKS